MKHDNIRNSICSYMFVFFVKFEKKKLIYILNNLSSNFIDTNNFTPHENNILLWIFPLTDIQATLPFPPSPPLKKFQKFLEYKERDFQLHQKKEEIFFLTCEHFKKKYC